MKTIDHSQRKIFESFHEKFFRIIYEKKIPFLTEMFALMETIWNFSKLPKAMQVATIVLQPIQMEMSQKLPK